MAKKCKWTVLVKRRRRRGHMFFLEHSVQGGPIKTVLGVRFLLARPVYVQIDSVIKVIYYSHKPDVQFGLQSAPD